MHRSFVPFNLGTSLPSVALLDCYCNYSSPVGGGKLSKCRLKAKANCVPVTLSASLALISNASVVAV